MHSPVVSLQPRHRSEQPVRISAVHPTVSLPLAFSVLSSLCLLRHWSAKEPECAMRDARRISTLAQRPCLALFTLPPPTHPGHLGCSHTCHTELASGFEVDVALDVESPRELMPDILPVPVT